MTTTIAPTDGIYLHLWYLEQAVINPAFIEVRSGQ
jgi:hypothetical protein